MDVTILLAALGIAGLVIALNDWWDQRQRNGRGPRRVDPPMWRAPRGDR